MSRRFIDITIEIDNATSDEEAARMALAQLRGEEFDMVVSEYGGTTVTHINSAELETE